MFILTDFNRRSAVRVALALDELSDRIAEPLAILCLARMKNQTLDSRTASLSARRADRQALKLIAQLSEALKLGLEFWDVLPRLREVERALLERERRRGKEAPLIAQKRLLLQELQELAVEIDDLDRRQAKLIWLGASESGPVAELHGDSFDACDRRMHQLSRRFAQLRLAIRAMDSVQLLHSEEVALAQLEKDCALYLPDPDEMEADIWRLEMKDQAFRERAEALARLRERRSPAEKPAAPPPIERVPAARTEVEILREAEFC